MYDGLRLGLEAIILQISCPAEYVDTKSSRLPSAISLQSRIPGKWKADSVLGIMSAILEKSANFTFISRRRNRVAFHNGSFALR